MGQQTSRHALTGTLAPSEKNDPRGHPTGKSCSTLMQAVQPGYSPRLRSQAAGQEPRAVGDAKDPREHLGFSAGSPLHFRWEFFTELCRPFSAPGPWAPAGRTSSLLLALRF